MSSPCHIEMVICEEQGNVKREADNNQLVVKLSKRRQARIAARA